MDINRIRKLHLHIQAYETFEEFHQQYIDSVGKPDKLSAIMHSIMDKKYVLEHNQLASM